MYAPVQPGIERAAKGYVRYQEILPPTDMLSSIGCFYRPFSIEPLEKVFSYCVIPDGCVDIVFDISPNPEFEGALIMTPALSAVTLDFGHSFDYAGIRLRPGVWTSLLDEIVGGALYLDEIDGCDFRAVGYALRKNPKEFVHRLQKLAEVLEDRKVVRVDKLTKVIIENEELSIDILIKATGYSRRHVQRLMYKRTGYRPHDFIKVMRFQQSLRNHSFEIYADQAHFIREFRRFTNMTPRMFEMRYGFSKDYTLNVRNIQ